MLWQEYIYVVKFHRKLMKDDRGMFSLVRLYLLVVHLDEWELPPVSPAEKRSPVLMFFADCFWIIFLVTLFVHSDGGRSKVCIKSPCTSISASSAVLAVQGLLIQTLVSACHIEAWCNSGRQDRSHDIRPFSLMRCEFANIGRARKCICSERCEWNWNCEASVQQQLEILQWDFQTEKERSHFGA